MNQKEYKTFNSWRAMKDRCYRKNHPRFARYGGRGIIVCPEWKNDFMNFHNWAILNGWQQGLTIERKDNNGNYCPENCCWISLKEQNRNRKTSKYITIFNETKLAIDWTKDKRCKVTENNFYWRLRNGMEPEKALTIPKQILNTDSHKNFRKKYLTEKKNNETTK